MIYEKSSAPSMRRMATAVGRLLCDEFCDLELMFQGHGYSGKVHRLTVRDSRGLKTDYVVKGVSDDVPYRFYQEILAPWELNSPTMFGVFDGGDSLYLLLEHIPHDQPDWSNPAKYRRTIDWLARKDRIAGQRLASLLARPYLQRFDIGSLERRVEPVREAVRDGIDPLLDARLLRALAHGGAQFRRAARRIRTGPQTVTHNDLQMLNVLFCNDHRRGELFVVDWTQPAVGSVCVDLATLLHVAPAPLRGALRRRYLAHHSDFHDFPETFAAAQMHVHLSMLSWMIDAMRTGHRRAVHRTKLREIVTHLMRYFE